MDFIAEHGTLQHVIDSQSPWQQGRTERAGASFKEDLLLCDLAGQGDHIVLVERSGWTGLGLVLGSNFAALQNKGNSDSNSKSKD